MSVDIDTLVTAVVRGVLEQLEAKPGPVALVLAPSDERLAREVEKRLGGGMRVCFSNQAPAEDPVLYVVPELSCSDMADLAAGKGSCLALREVLDLLLRGKSVRTLGFAYRAHAATAPHALLHLYQGYEATLASYGLTELAPCAPESVLVRDTLVTAEHVAMAAKGGVRSLRVPYHAVVTPLAQQTAAENGMTILKNL